LVCINFGDKNEYSLIGLGEYNTEKSVALEDLIFVPFFVPIEGKVIPTYSKLYQKVL
jgi:hypothetical protein